MVFYFYWNRAVDCSRPDTDKVWVGFKVAEQGRSAVAAEHVVFSFAGWGLVSFYLIFSIGDNELICGHGNVCCKRATLCFSALAAMTNLYVVQLPFDSVGDCSAKTTSGYHFFAPFYLNSYGLEFTL